MPESLGKTVEDPDYVILGAYGEHIAIRKYEESKYLVVPYTDGGEVKTAFITTKVNKMLTKRRLLWKR